MSTIRVQIKWKKFSISDFIPNTADALCIQNIPVAIVKHNCGLGYFIEYVDKMDPPIKTQETYFEKKETAIKRVEQRFGIYSDKFGDLYLIDDPYGKQLSVNSNYNTLPIKAKKEIKGISEKRIQNLRNAMPVIFWDEKTIKITIKGYGDRPAFTIKGTYSMPGGITFSILWHSFTPGGGQSGIYYKGKRYKANLTTGMNIINNLIKLEEIQKMKPEGDTDLETFREAMEKAGQSVTFKEYTTDRSSRIRHHDSYSTYKDEFKEDLHCNIPLDELDFIELSDDGKFYEVHIKGGICTGFRLNGVKIGPSVKKFRSTKCISYKPPYLEIR